MAKRSYLKTEAQKLARAEDRRALEKLRREIAKARERRKAAYRKANALCKAGRARARAAIKKYREAERHRINQEVDAIRERTRRACKARKAAVMTIGYRTESRRKAALIERQREQRRLAKLTRETESKRARATSRAERRQESDAEVSSNLPAELRPVWARVKRSIRPKARTTRTEAFLEWAEAHPEELVADSRGIDREIAAMVRERNALERRLAKAKPVTPSARKAKGGASKGRRGRAYQPEPWAGQF